MQGPKLPKDYANSDYFGIVTYNRSTVLFSGMEKNIKKYIVSYDFDEDVWKIITEISVTYGSHEPFLSQEKSGKMYYL